MASAGGDDDKLYKILGVGKKASDGEIKQNYRKLAKQYHPDKNPEAGDKFKEISFAYDILSDPEKRRTYDRYGLQGLQEGGDAGGDDLLNRVFGSFFGGRMSRGGERARPKCEDKIKQHPVTLEQLYNGGTTINLDIQRVVLCSGCDGRGGKFGAAKQCKYCSGTGTRITLQQLVHGLVRQISSRCTDCNGMGEVYNDRDRCKECVGQRTKEETKTLEVHIDKGMQNMQKIMFREEGNQVPNYDKGNVIVVLIEEKHSRFERTGNDLIMNHKLSLTEALCGFTLAIKHLSDRHILVKCSPGEIIKNSDLKIVVGEGMPLYKNPFEHGNLYIKFTVEYPENNYATFEQMQTIEMLLPTRPNFTMPQGDDVEEVNMYDYDASQNTSNNNYESDDEGGKPGPGNVQCASQ